MSTRPFLEFLTVGAGRLTLSRSIISGDQNDSFFGRSRIGESASYVVTRHARGVSAAETLHRTGAIEVWGRGTNRVIDACRAYGIAEPTFKEVSGAVTVTFKAEIVASAGDLGPGGHQVGTKCVPSSSA
jgi:hypothetical protein